MKRMATIILVLLFGLIIFWMIANAASPGPDSPVVVTPSPSDEAQEIARVEDAIYQKIEVDRQNTIFFWNSTISVQKTGISDDGQWAASIMVPMNPRTEQIPETEPALAITTQVDGEWVPIFPNDPGYTEAIENAPEDLLSPEHKEILLQMNFNAAVNIPATALSGYLLPWEAGTSYYLTGSTCHDGYIESGNAHYAFDFAYNRTMWDILAAKAGEVWVWNDDVPTCYEPSCWRDQPVGNYIVLRDTSTDPVTYQLYLHLKQDSIPDEIKVRGFRVSQGQFIGIVDNTGQSSGSHLHFQVQVPYLGEDHYWGRSVDITFDDVPVNGGRPRIHNPNYCLDFNFCDMPGDVCKTSQLYYTSQNQRIYPKDSTPPIGDITQPNTGETHTTSLHLEGWAVDLGDGTNEPSGLHSAHFMAYYNNGWTDIGPEFDIKEFSYDWDWCSNDVPEGPVSVALRITDNRGNQTSGLPGLQHVIKHYDCSPELPPVPTCQPTSNQVAIFSDINYQGQCQILGNGSFPNSGYFSLVGEDNTRSVLVGANLQAQLFTEANYVGRSEILRGNDPNLSDNLTASGTLSSIKVSARTLLADVPTLDAPNVPLMNNMVLETNVEYTAPFTDTFEGDVSAWNTSTDGWWHLSQQQSRSASHSWRYGIEATNNYNDLSANKGFLESPIITLPVSSDPYVLQFWYRYQTESHYMHWDQRWVQISIDGFEYKNVYQLSDDPMLGWFRARIDLFPDDMNSEHTVQVRFFFDTKDKYQNDYEGWFIDDFQIKAEPVTTIACPDDPYEINDSPDSAKTLSYGVTANAVICPGWDIDYFKFTGNAGDQIVLDIDAKSVGSNLDGYLFLLDSDGGSELAENDDEILYEKQDPYLTYILPRDGEYYLKFHAWDHPMGTGSYSLKLLKEDQDPLIKLLNPIEGSTIPIGKVTISAIAADIQSDIHSVRFFYHDSNWQTGKWIDIGTDKDGSDGWDAVLDTSSFSDGEIISVYAAAYDLAGNWNHDAAWKVKVDTRPLLLNLSKLPNPTQSTAIYLRWSLSGSGSETAMVDVQEKVNNTTWSDLQIHSQQTDLWLVRKAGNKYAFMVTAQDYAGNQVTAQTNTSIPAANVLCSQPDAWDKSASQNDNTFLKATPIILNGGAQDHNFCNPESTDYLKDQDWLSFFAESGQLYALFAIPKGDMSAAVNIRLYSANGTTLLAKKDAAKFGNSTSLFWKATESGKVFIQLDHVNSEVAGNGTAYSVRLTDGSIYLPLIKK